MTLSLANKILRHCGREEEHLAHDWNLNSARFGGFVHYCFGGPRPATSTLRGVEGKEGPR